MGASENVFLSHNC